MKDILPVNGQFVFDQLPYSDLSPVISAETLSFHHGKHLKAYVDNLNKLLSDNELKGKPLSDVILGSKGALFNNAGQVYNHTLYFEQFGKGSHGPSGHILELIVRDFGSFDDFKKQFEQQGATLFGSGWVWLSLDKQDKLVITQHPNADSPLTLGYRPLLTFDVWEHAYYLDYQNRRADHLAALWPLVDWTKVAERL